MSTSRSARAKKPPTALNLFALRSVFGDRHSVPNQIAATDVPHLKRCMDAGLVKVGIPGRSGTLELTPEGLVALRGA